MTKKIKTQEVAVITENNPLSKPNDLEAQMVVAKKLKEIRTKYIQSELVEGVDFGKIEFKNKNTGQSTFSKPTLFKAGGEKFMVLFNLKATFIKDKETYNMAGKPTGLFCYICRLVNVNGEIVGEGRGCANLNEKQGWIENNAVKIAEKRAQIDAILRTGGLSDVFTQDIEDMPKSSLSGSAGSGGGGEPSEAQCKFVGDLIRLKYGISPELATEKTKLIKTREDASKVITALKDRTNAKKMNPNEEDFSKEMVDDDLNSILKGENETT